MYTAQISDVCVCLLTAIGDRFCLDVQRIIPLPEADELTIQLRRRETAVRAAASGRDWTSYVISSPTGDGPPLRKRRAVLAMVQALAERGSEPPDLSLRVARAVFADPVWPVEGFADDVRPGGDGAGVVGVNVVDGDRRDARHRVY
jgi:hypothetical protein